MILSGITYETTKTITVKVSSALIPYFLEKSYKAHRLSFPFFSYYKDLFDL